MQGYNFDSYKNKHPVVIKIKNMNKIIVPVDFSKYAENALRVAANIAKKQNTEIVAVHMMGLSDAILTKEHSSSLEGMFHLQLTQKRFAEFLDKDYLTGITVSQVVKNYTVFSELDDVAREHDASLIVMGSHGSSGLSEVFVGSNTEKVVRTAQTPVLVVKNLAHFNIKRATFACDFQLENIEALKKVTALCNTLNVNLELVYINTAGENFMTTLQIEQRITDFLKVYNDDKLQLEHITIFADYTVEQGVFNFAKKINADLISLPTHGRKGLAHFMSGSIGEDVVNHAEIPVLTIKL